MKKFAGVQEISIRPDPGFVPAADVRPGRIAFPGTEHPEFTWTKARLTPKAQVLACGIECPLDGPLYGGRRLPSRAAIARSMEPSQAVPYETPRLNFGFEIG